MRDRRASLSLAPEKASLASLPSLTWLLKRLNPNHHCHLSSGRRPTHGQFVPDGTFERLPSRYQSNIQQAVILFRFPAEAQPKPPEPQHPARFLERVRYKSPYMKIRTSSVVEHTKS